MDIPVIHDALNIKTLFQSDQEDIISIPISNVAAAIIFVIVLIGIILSYIFWPDFYKATSEGKKEITQLINQYYKEYNAGNIEAVKALYVPEKFRSDYVTDKYAAKNQEERITYNILDIIERETFGFAYIETSLYNDNSTRIKIEAKFFYYRAEWMILKIGTDEYTKKN